VKLGSVLVFSRVLGALSLPLAALLAASCQSLAGIDDYELGPCGAFCDTVMANCQDENKVYASRANCMSVCRHLPPGDPNERGNDNSILCRYEAAKQAATGEANIECQRAGPGGGDWCGTECEAYCLLFSQICSAEPEQKNCEEKCLGLRDDGNLQATDDHEGDTLQCRLVHVSAAEPDPKYHCGHAQLANPTQWCNNDALKPPRPPDCGDFCKLVAHVCEGDFQVYESEAQCNALCQYFDPGANSDSKGQNTLGCRKYHTYNAMNDAVTHCPHLGPGGAGVCGDSKTGNCDSYCDISVQVCGAQFAANFSDREDCMAQCAELPPGGKYSVVQAESEPETLGCRLLSLQRAAEDPTQCDGVFGGAPCE
jgi:hypothetical protein